MQSERLFRLFSYAVVVCGFVSLWVSGIFGLVGTSLFLVAVVAGWMLEGSRWQISERVGTVLIVLALPAYYLLLRAGFFGPSNADQLLPAILARLIVTLSAIKILQRKSDRDWIFLYIMSFFEVLLAAGLSISAMYLASFIAYVFTMVAAVILFEMRRTGRSHPAAQAVLTPARIPVTAAVLIVFIIGLAAPMFFMLPRVGGAGFGGRGSGGAETASGFSDTVRLGGIGTIQQNDEVIMRVRIDDGAREGLDDIRWRGIALDTFDGQSWRKSTAGFADRIPRGERDLIQVDTARGRDRFVLQTVYLEPMNSPVIFVLPRVLGVQGGMPYVLRDAGGSLSLPSRGERVSYRVLSETSVPDAARLRRDNGLYADEHYNYLQLPDTVDPRITELASQFTRGTSNRYDAARGMENYLQTQFGYTLEQKAGGDEPLADFLFNVREGHCEYFATAMAVMLRTQGIATRVVNGFQRGEYNETADVFVVRQRHAHSWVEVYFPGEGAWVTFDPTPFAGQDLSSAATGITKRLGSYLEALETFWIQYFVAYDSAEQRVLFTSIRRSAAEQSRSASSWIDTARQRIVQWWSEARGDKGFETSVTAIGYGAAYLAAAGLSIVLFVWLYRRIVKLTLWRRLWERFFGARRGSVVEFYERMLAVLASKGIVRPPHQTPLEFAYSVGTPEVVSITEKYNRVRFGEKRLSADEAETIESWLEELKTTDEHR